MKDYARDKNKADFYRLSLCNEIPSFVKEAHLMEEPNLSKLTGSQFADKSLRLFPINSRPEAWVSAAYIKKQASEGKSVNPDVMYRIKEACELWEIDFDAIAGEQDLSINKVAANHLVIQYRDESMVHASVPVAAKEHLDKIAADILAGNHTYQIRRNVARQILGATDVLGHSFDRDTQIAIEKTAGYGVGSLVSATQAIAQRRCAIDKEYPQHAQDLRLVEKFAADSSDAEGILEGDTLDKIASILDAIDRQAGLKIKYNDTFQLPERQLYAVSTSQVDSFRDNMVKLANGRFFMQGRFNHKKVSEFLSDVFNKEAGDIIHNMKSLNVSQAHKLSTYIDKFASDAEEEGFVADIDGVAADDLKDDPASPVQEDTIGDVEKGPAVKGLETLEDASAPREGVNEDSTSRSV